MGGGSLYHISTSEVSNEEEGSQRIELGGWQQLIFNTKGILSFVLVALASVLALCRATEKTLSTSIGKR